MPRSKVNFQGRLQSLLFPRDKFTSVRTKEGGGKGRERWMEVRWGADIRTRSVTRYRKIIWAARKVYQFVFSLAFQRKSIKSRTHISLSSIPTSRFPPYSHLLFFFFFLFFCIYSLLSFFIFSCGFWFICGPLLSSLYFFNTTFDLPFDSLYIIKIINYIIKIIYFFNCIYLWLPPTKSLLSQSFFFFFF